MCVHHIKGSAHAAVLPAPAQVYPIISTAVLGMLLQAIRAETWYHWLHSASTTGLTPVDAINFVVAKGTDTAVHDLCMRTAAVVLPGTRGTSVQFCGSARCNMSAEGTCL